MAACAAVDVADRTSATSTVDVGGGWEGGDVGEDGEGGDVGEGGEGGDVGEDGEGRDVGAGWGEAAVAVVSASVI